MASLDIAKDVIKDYYREAECGLFSTRNVIGDPMDTIYDDGKLTIDICYRYEYFEVFGLSQDEFNELKKFYRDLVRE